MKILVVDDSRIIRSILRNILQDRNISADEIFDAADGSEALNFMLENDVDMVLLDWNMPKLNGLELLKSVRSIPKYKNTPIIMVTSEAAKYNVMEAIKAGVSEYVVKPITATKVLEKIDKFLKK